MTVVKNEPPSAIHVTHIQWREFLCGFGAAFVNITVTFPINKIMFRQVADIYIYLSCPHISLYLHTLMLVLFIDAAWSSH